MVEQNTYQPPRLWRQVGQGALSDLAGAAKGECTTRALGVMTMSWRQTSDCAMLLGIRLAFVGRHANESSISKFLVAVGQF